MRYFRRLATIVILAFSGLLVLSTITPLNPVTAESERNTPVYRFLQRQSKVHFYTASLWEKNNTIMNLNSAWYYENIAYYAYLTDSSERVPVYRFLHKQQKIHFYTASLWEKNFVEGKLGNVWQYEAIAFYVYPVGGSGRKAVYRFLHKRNKIHFYTASSSERDTVRNTLGAVWQYEGVAFYVDQSSMGLQPEQIATNCPVSTQTCVPCTIGTDSRCRAVSGDTSGYLGWACQNNNPGNIRGGTTSEFNNRNRIITEEGREGACGQRGGYMVFRDYTIGREGLKAYIRGIRNGRHSSYLPVCADGACSIKQFFGIYAPAGDQNDPHSYANNVANRLGVNADTTTLAWIVSNKLDEFVSAIQSQEGWFTAS